MISSALLLGVLAVPAPAAEADECPSGPVALTFDDGPVPGRTDRVLDVLASRDATATFFVNGHLIERAPATLQRIAAEGHIVANHTWGHRNLARVGESVIRRELLDNVAAAAAAGVSMAPLVRPPFGATSLRVETVIGELGMTPVMWTVDPQDWRGSSAASLAAHVVRRLRAGANVLFHDGSPRSTIGAALPAILDEIARRGFCPGVFDAAGIVVPASALDPLPDDPGLACVGPQPCDRLGYFEATGEWRVSDARASGAGTRTFWFGDSGDAPLVGDWDCDGVDGLGVFRESTATVHLRDSPAPGPADHTFTFGNPGDVVLAGDWDGDGCDTLAVYRTGEARMYLSNRLGPGSAETAFTFGDPGDTPLAGDFDGDGRDDLGLHRRSTGRIYLRLQHRPGPADLQFTFGNPGDRIVVGDWDGDGIDTPAAYRPTTNAWYIKLANTAGPADHTVRFGTPTRAGSAVAGAFDAIPQSG